VSDATGLTKRAAHLPAEPPTPSSTEPAAGAPAADALVPIPMEQAVGYGRIDARPAVTIAENLVLKHESVFLLVDTRGDIAPPGAPGVGLYHADTRMLSRYELRVAGGPAAVLSSEAPRMYAAQIDLAVSDAAFGGAAWTATNAVHIRRDLLVDQGLSERVTVTSFLARPVDYWIELALGCDFADIFEVRGWPRERRGEFFAPRWAEDTLRFAYRGRDGAMIGSRVWFATPPTERASDHATWTFRLEPNQPVVLEWQVLPEPVGAPAPIPAPLAIEQRRAAIAGWYERWRGGCARWRTDVAEFDGALVQATDDLRALYVEADGERVITAGIPWYVTAFGRDSIITSLQTLGLNPAIAVDTLRYLARHQGVRDNPVTEEQPGKIMHEIRRGELARAGEIPHVPYYGSVDATPLWLILLHEVWRWTGDEAIVRAMLPHAARALAWIDDHGDIDGDGFVEYTGRSASRGGLTNQGWKDSYDGVPFPDGRLPEPPIALVEVQGYVYDAKARMATLYEALGETARAEELRRGAAALRDAIDAHFWLEELGTYALALDGEKRPVPTITTNAGHLLWSRVPDQGRADRVAARLLAPDMSSGWGIRTLSALHSVYNPMSYHDGSVWPHDNALVALGLSLYRHTQDAVSICGALHDVASGMPYHRLPELYCGLTRGHGTRPVLYPVSCSPQAWAAGSLFMLLQAVTGILPDAPGGVLTVREPLLPPFMRQLEVRGLTVGRSRVTCRFTRHRDRTLATITDVGGDALRVRIEV
jgi:glycogen debranching enzyme